MESLVSVDCSSIGYGRKKVLRDVRFVVAEGEFWGFVGPNGAGKTTLLRAMAGLIRVRDGTVKRREGLRFGYVPQRQSLDPIFPFTAREVVAMAARIRHGREVVEERSAHALETAGVLPLAGKFFRDLSGGQKQRVLLARALAVEPEIVLLDEPVTDLDPAGQWSILNLLARIREERGVTIILITHLLDLIVNYAAKIAFVDRGTVTVGTREDLCRAETLRDTFGVDLLVREVDGRLHLVPAEGHDG